MKKASPLALFAVLTSAAFSQVTVYSDRASWEVATGGGAVTEDFESFTTTTGFRDSPTQLSNCTINAVNSAQHPSVNLVDVMPTIHGLYPTNYAYAFINADEPSNPGTEITFDPTSPTDAFAVDYDLTVPGEGFDLILVAGGVEFFEVDVFGILPDLGFVGIVSSQPFDRVIMRASILNPGGSGEIFGFDNVSFGEGNLGTSYCMANPNSTGAAGELSASGSRVVADNNLQLTASSLPAHSFGYVIVSRTQGFVAMPGGSQGNLCVSGVVGRYVGPGQIQITNGAGQFTLLPDLTQTPQPNGFVAIVAGEAWNFQVWHRDSGATGATSNFTSGLEVNFL